MFKVPKETRTKKNINVCSKSRRFEYLMIILTSKRERETIFFMTMFAVSKPMKTNELYEKSFIDRTRTEFIQIRLYFNKIYKVL
jgi:hypothetical protein